MVTRKYQNAVQDDLWEAMDTSAVADGLDLPADVKTIMDSWSLQTGYPIVTIQRNYDNQSASITQVTVFEIWPWFITCYFYSFIILYYYELYYLILLLRTFSVPNLGVYSGSGAILLADWSQIVG